LAASEFTQSYWYVVLAYAISTVIWYKLLYKYILPFRVIIDKILISWGIVWKLNKTFSMYRFAKLFWDFYNAWISPTKALQQVANTLPNYHYNKKILEIKNDLEMWLSLSEAIEEDNLFDPILIQIIWIWESTWEIWPLLVIISKYYKDEVDNTIDIMTKMIEPLMMAFIAIIVWWLVASVFLPMGNLMDTIN
jgi:type IV pilus assembly protein PilC